MEEKEETRMLMMDPRLKERISETFKHYEKGIMVFGIAAGGLRNVKLLTHAGPAVGYALLLGSLGLLWQAFRTDAKSNYNLKRYYQLGFHLLLGLSMVPLLHPCNMPFIYDAFLAMAFAADGFATIIDTTPTESYLYKYSLIGALLASLGGISLS